MITHQSCTMKTKLQLSIIFLFLITNVYAKTITVGSGQKYESLQQAAAVVQPGDIIVILNGVYTQREDISNLNGEAEAPIIIYAEEEGKVIYRGQSEAWHLSSCTNLFIYGFVFENQTSNGVNIDDSGNYDNSTFNITIKNCIFRDMNASGNNDLLKLSGLNDFTIENCTFLNGADGGSGVDMVGCHQGKFIKNRFENMGSNCIQVKGGSQFITITQNTFINGGNRSLNLGGNTGLEYFRPHDAPFEAADVDVYSNVFIKSWAPIAYVGSVRIKVYNNTFYKPENWVFRILQETVDTNRFLPCGDNEFSNNIIYFGNNLHRIVNIGPNTASETFKFNNNLWYNFDNPDFHDTGLPAAETNSIIQQDPLFVNEFEYNFDLVSSSPAIGNGVKHFAGELDFKDRYFPDACSIGAFEYNGIYKDFTGEPGTIWYYHYGYWGDYQTINITGKDTSDQKEVSHIDNDVFSYDFGGNRMQFDLSTTGGITYIGNIYGDKNEFNILYDYNLKAKDTLSSQSYCSGTFKTLIDSVKFDYLAGKVRKVFITSRLSEGAGYDCPDYFGEPGKLIEGIHSVNSFMLGSEYYNNIYSDSLRCYTYYNEKGAHFTEHFLDFPCDYIKVATEDAGTYAIKIFPNPVNNIININLEDNISGTIEIFNISGKILLSRRYENSNSFHFDISSFPQGTYYLKIKTKSGLYLYKFIKM